MAKAAKKKKGKASKRETDRADDALAMAAVEKMQAGGAPTERERRALARVEKRQGGALRRHHYETIAKKEWREMSGRSNQVLNEQADRHGAPLRGKTIHLPDFIKWFHDFLAENSHALVDSKDSAAFGGAELEGKEQLARQRKARADKLEMEIAQDQGDLIPVEDFRTYWEIICGQMRKAESALQRRFGREAATILKKARKKADHEARKIGNTNGKH